MSIPGFQILAEALDMLEANKAVSDIHTVVRWLKKLREPFTWSSAWATRSASRDMLGGEGS